MSPGGEPHVPRRKRSKPTELIRPLEVLAASNAAASGILLKTIAYLASVTCLASIAFEVHTPRWALLDGGAVECDRIR